MACEVCATPFGPAAIFAGLARRLARDDLWRLECGSGRATDGIAIRRPLAPRRAGVSLHVACVPIPSLPDHPSADHRTRFGLQHRRPAHRRQHRHAARRAAAFGRSSRAEAGEIGAARPGLHRQDRALAIRRRGVRRRRPRPAGPGPERRQSAREGRARPAVREAASTDCGSATSCCSGAITRTSITDRSPTDAGSSPTRWIARHRLIPTPIRTAWSSSRPGA